MSQLYFDGKCLNDFGIFVDTANIHKKPKKRVTKVSVPGRNGDLILKEKETTFDNIEIVFPCFIREGFEENFNDLMNYLGSRKGYKVLQSDSDWDTFRMGMYLTELAPETGAWLKYGKFSLTFDCMPQRFLTAGQTMTEVTNGAEFYSPSAFDSQPLLRVYGNGTLTVNSDVITVANNSNAYVDIDSELMDCYYGTVNLNSKVSFATKEYPVLVPGSNTISFTGITKVELKPRWWVI